MFEVGYNFKFSKFILVGFFVIILFLISSIIVSAESIVADHIASSEFEDIPNQYFDIIHNDYHIYYGHTSHGSQIITGLLTLEGENSLYDPPFFHEVSDDLGHNGDISWEPDIRNYLDNNPECNMVMMSWCGGCSDNTVEGINIYLNTFNQLEIDYPDVIFIYMTGHLDGTGVGGTLYSCNNQIRDYCNANDKVLFDFADIESWDPDGNYYPDDTDYCNWCTDWCMTHDCPGCSCAHSQCINCYLKGKGWWWMMARLSGWEGTGGSEDTTPPEIEIIKPVNGIYINNKKIISSPLNLVILSIEIEVILSDDESGVDRVEFYIDDSLVESVNTNPYSWFWDEKSFRRHNLKVVAYDVAGNFAFDEISLFKIL